MTTKSKAGRKPDPGEKAYVKLFLTKAQREKLKELGSSIWLQRYLQKLIDADNK